MLHLAPLQPPEQVHVPLLHVPPWGLQLDRHESIAKPPTVDVTAAAVQPPSMFQLKLQPPGVSQYNTTYSSPVPPCNGISAVP